MEEQTETNCCFRVKARYVLLLLLLSQVIHTWQSYLDGVNVQSGLAVSPFTEAKQIPSTDWEETFPSAL